MPRKTNTLLTALNSSFEALAGGSLDLPLSTAAGGGGGSCLVLRDLRISKNYWTYSVVTIYGCGWFVGKIGEQKVKVPSKASAGGV
jgi:hypothetical protein